MYFYLLALTVLAIDQISKYFVVLLMSPNQSIPLIENIFHLTYVQNYGAAFGILAHRRGLFVIVSLAVVVLILIYHRSLPDGHPYLRTALALQLGGALGNNVFDRLRLGYVIDFFDFQVWPVFNVADMAIVVGIGLLIIEVARMPREKGN
ncbi:MAG: signal peptidase II [Dethiobacter sp.]|jgi:signal peptidase II|nr:signal peptidase II [Dethiobacter sp.]